MDTGRVTSGIRAVHAWNSSAIAEMWWALNEHSNSCLPQTTGYPLGGQIGQLMDDSLVKSGQTVGQTMWKPSVTAGGEREGAGAAQCSAKITLAWTPLSLSPGLLQQCFLQQLLYKPLSSHENKCLAICPRARKPRSRFKFKRSQPLFLFLLVLSETPWRGWVSLLEVSLQCWCDREPVGAAGIRFGGTRGESGWEQCSSSGLWCS